MRIPPGPLFVMEEDTKCARQLYHSQSCWEKDIRMLWHKKSTSSSHPWSNTSLVGTSGEWLWPGRGGGSLQLMRVPHEWGYGPSLWGGTSSPPYFIDCEIQMMDDSLCTPWCHLRWSDWGGKWRSDQLYRCRWIVFLLTSVSNYESYTPSTMRCEVIQTRTHNSGVSRCNWATMCLIRMIGHLPIWHCPKVVVRMNVGMIRGGLAVPPGIIFTWCLCRFYTGRINHNRGGIYGGEEGLWWCGWAVMHLLSKEFCHTSTTLYHRSR